MAYACDDARLVQWIVVSTIVQSSVWQRQMFILSILAHELSGLKRIRAAHFKFEHGCAGAFFRAAPPSHLSAGRRMGEMIKEKAKVDHNQLLYVVVDEAVRAVGTKALPELKSDS